MDATGPLALVHKILDGFLKDSRADSSSSVVTSSPRCLFLFSAIFFLLLSSFQDDLAAELDGLDLVDDVSAFLKNDGLARQ